MTAEHQLPPPRKHAVPLRLQLVTTACLLLALISTLDPFFLILGGGVCIGLVLLLQEGLARLLARWPMRTYLRLAILLFPALAISSYIVLTCNPITSRNQALRLALGTEPPPDMTDLHVKELGFTDYCVFAFFRSSPNSIKKLLGNPIYRRHEHPGKLDMSRTCFDDLAHMGIITNVIVYSRTDIAGDEGGGNLMVDLGHHFVFVSYGVD